MKTFIRILLIAGLFIFAIGCKPEKFQLKFCENDTSCLVFFNILFPPQEPCQVDAVLKPGDTKTFQIDPVYLGGQFVVRGCSSNPWMLTVTPPAGATVAIKRQLSTCTGTISLSSSSAPGAPASISGPAGCMTSTSESIQIDGYSAAGTVTVNFN